MDLEQNYKVRSFFNLLSFYFDLHFPIIILKKMAQIACLKWKKN